MYFVNKKKSCLLKASAFLIPINKESKISSLTNLIAITLWYFLFLVSLTVYIGFNICMSLANVIRALYVHLKYLMKYLTHLLQNHFEFYSILRQGVGVSRLTPTKPKKISVISSMRQGIWKKWDFFFNNRILKAKDGIGLLVLSCTLSLIITLI